MHASAATQTFVREACAHLGGLVPQDAVIQI